MTVMYPIHPKPTNEYSYDRLDMLWKRYPQYHEMTVFCELEELLNEHESYRKDFEELREEYESNRYDRFLVRLSWSDLPYRYATRELIEKTHYRNRSDNPIIKMQPINRPFTENCCAASDKKYCEKNTACEESFIHAAASACEESSIHVAGSACKDSFIHAAGSACEENLSQEALSPFKENPYIKAFMEQFRDLDTDHKACFLFPESFVSQFFVILEVCKKAESFHPMKNIFPDEEKIHYLAVFDKSDMDSVLLMYHLLYTNSTEDLYGGYSLYDYSLPWYQSHLWVDGIVLRSPYLPDRLAKYQGNLPFHHNPAKTVYVRRNVEHLLECGYIESELEFFLDLTRTIMPLFQWWYTDLAMYEEKDGLRTNWRLERTRIRTELTAEGIIRPKWKHELTLFRTVRKRYPDTLYQYRPEWLGRQSLDLYIPSLQTAIEYQGIQHYRPVGFFGGEEALSQRRELDRQKRELCEENGVRLIEWPYSLDPTDKNVREVTGK